MAAGDELAAADVGVAAATVVGTAAAAAGAAAGVLEEILTLG